MYTYRLLNHETVQPFLPLALQPYRPLLVASHDPLMAIGASYFWQPVGLVVASMTPDAIYAQIVSLVVAKTHRRHGIGTSLISEAEAVLRAQGCQQVDFGYMTGDESAVAIERAVAKNGWRAPRTVNVICESNPERYVGSPLQTTEIALPEGYEIFAWAELTETERAAIEVRQATTAGGWYITTASPFMDEARLERVNSVGLRCNGEVIGWMITHRISPDAVSYTTLFVAREHKGQSLGMALVAAATRRQFEHNIAHGQAWTTHFRLFADSQWTKLLLEFTGAAFRIREYHVSSKMLQDEQAEPLIERLSELPEHFLRVGGTVISSGSVNK